MKKIIVSLVLVGMLFSFSPVAKAQSTPSQQEITSQLITLLTQLIAQLQQQIADILAEQETMKSSINAISGSSAPSAPAVEYPKISIPTFEHGAVGGFGGSYSNQ